MPQRQEQIPAKPPKTRERILEAARILFNQYGIDDVSTRRIAEALNISHGNLCYHFPKKDDIISALYFHLVDIMSKHVNALESQQSGHAMTLRDVAESCISAFQILYDYKFLLLDFVGIMRKIPEIKDHYRELIRLKKEQFALLRRYLVSRGWLRGDMEERYHEDINEIMMIVGDFWISSAEILFAGKEEEKVQYYGKVFQTLFIPLLTEQGLQEWHRVFSNNLHA